MLAYPYSDNHVWWPQIVQPKLNGVRAMVSPDGRVFMRSGRENHILHMQFGLPPFWLDGELMLPNGKLQDITGAIHQREADDVTEQLQFFAFDVISADSQRTRLLMLAELNHKLPQTHIVTYATVHNLSAALALKWDYNNLDGLMFRKPDVSYMYGKSRNLHKRKNMETAEFLCVGVVEGLGKFTGALGSFTLRMDDKTTFQCGGGDLTHLDRIRFWKFKPVGEMITVAFPYKSAAGIPQLSQFVCIRKNNE